MSILVRFNPVSMSAETYDAVLKRIEAASESWPPEGLDYHCCFGPDGDLKVSEIWDSQEQFAAFGEVLMPILSESGIEFAGEPEIFPIHNIMRQAA